MKVGVSSNGPSPDADVDAAFGRCPYFVVVDLEKECLETVSNPGLNAQSGAGPTTAQALKTCGVDVVLTGHVGPNAERALDAADIEVVQDASGNVRSALEAFLSDRFGIFDLGEAVRKYRLNAKHDSTGQ